MRPQYCPPLLLPPLSAGYLQCPQYLDEICISCLHSPCFSVLPLPPMAEQKTRPKPGEVVSHTDSQAMLKHQGSLTSLRCAFPKSLFTVLASDRNTDCGGSRVGWAYTISCDLHKADILLLDWKNLVIPTLTFKLYTVSSLIYVFIFRVVRCRHFMDDNN